MPTVVTNTGHVDLAIQFFNEYTLSQLWVGLGNPSSGSWQSPYSDTNPPTPAPNAPLDNPIGYKQIDNIYLIYPSSTGTITYQGSVWAISTVANAYVNQASYVYIAASINYTENGTFTAGTTYREIALFSDVVLNAGVTGPAVTASQVSSATGMLFLDYAEPTTIKTNEQEFMRYLLTF